MTPQQFLDEVVQPNVLAALTQPDSLQAASNAILTMDALVGIVFWHLRDRKHPSGSKPEYERSLDDGYRNDLAASSEAYKALRDAAASLKHGRLERRPEKRLMTEPRQMAVELNTIGYFQAGVDPLGSSLVYLDLKIGRLAAREIISDAFAFLTQLVFELPV